MRDAGGDLLPELLADDDGAGRRSRRAALFGGEWLRSLGMIPNEYLYYFYFAADTVDAIRESRRAASTCSSSRRASTADGRSRRRTALAAWRATKEERDRTYMAEARSGRRARRRHARRAAAATRPRRWRSSRRSPPTPRAVRIVNAANRSALPFLDERAVVEVPCRGRRRRRPAARRRRRCPSTPRALVDTIKAVERATIEAALTGSTALAVKALALHPLVPSVTAAREIFAGYRERLPVLEERFA